MSGIAQFDGGFDEDWGGAPVFGVRPSSAPWAIRPSAYGIINRDRIDLAVVRTKQGVYLPGGGVESGETTREAIRREALEECGLAVEVGVWETRCVQFIYSKAEGTLFEKRSVFVECSPAGLVAASCEIDHELVWVGFDAAVLLLSHESHCWAVNQWRSRASHQ
jgi:8-oxo-dGTP diphosphatase